MTVYDWNSMQPEQLNPLMVRRVVHMKGLTMARLEIAAGAEVPEHSHVHEQIVTVEKGALRFSIEGREVDVRSGQSLAIPSMVPHAVIALEATTVLDVFSPAREDWIAGDDAYLRG
jgi:quercetin dioxygenase-like cupin family protein